MREEGMTWLKSAQTTREQLGRQFVKIGASTGGGAKHRIPIAVVAPLTEPPVILSAVPMRLTELRTFTAAQLFELKEAVEVITYEKGSRETICYLIPWSLWEA